MQPGDVDFRSDEVVLGVHHALTLGSANHEFGIEGNKRGSRVRRIHRHAAIRMQNRVLPVAALRRIGIADVPTRAVARPTGAVIPASSILRHVAAKRALVPDLWRGYQFRALRQQLVLLSDDGMLDYFRQRGHRSDLDAVGGGANSLEFPDPAQIDDHLWFLDAVLEPIEAIHASGQHPAVVALLLEHLLRISNRVRLNQLESRHDVSDYGHGLSFRIPTKCAPLGDVAWDVPLRGT